MDDFIKTLLDLREGEGITIRRKDPMALSILVQRLLPDGRKVSEEQFVSNRELMYSRIGGNAEVINFNLALALRKVREVQG